MNPGWTPIQWLDPLQEVTESSLEELKRNREVLLTRTSKVQDALGVKLKKGHSCSSNDYHMFLEQLSGEVVVPVEMDAHDSRSLALERVLLTVESPQACRRSRVTKEGTIQVNTGMTTSEIKQSITRNSQCAQRRLRQEKEEQALCKEAIHQIQWELGLQKVYRSGIVSHEQFIGALYRMLDQKVELKGWLPGSSIGIASNGQFCHIGDDGSLIIPHNWN